MAARRSRRATARAPALDAVLDVLARIAPPELAAEWDNTGLVLEPSARRRTVARVLLTIDLTEAVVAEAGRAGVDLVVAYHPPIFRALKRLVAADPAQRAVLAAVRAGFAVWSPHTALDAASGGIADWLAGVVAGEDAAAGPQPCGEGGFGRRGELPAPVALATLLSRIKQRLGVRAVRLCLGPQGLRQRVRTFAVAAGAGGSVLRGERVDLWLTGELSHHDALAALAAGTAVLLGEHSNTERGYLPVLRRRLRQPFGGALEVAIARSDRDPFVHG